MRPALLGLCALIALPLAAQDLGLPVTGPEFDAYVTGRTLTYAAAGQIYGTEAYLPGRRVIWAFTQDQCREGYWYAQDAQICFVYEDPRAPQCWLFFKGAKGLQAQFLGSDGIDTLSEVAQSSEPLRCLGPEVGV